ncbi:MFS transporter [Candidatus Kaiserbacteria bacterium]|nr:MFS transporter [Candidatus Kaiserbacteria bacterium]
MKLSVKDYQGVHFSFDILALYLNRLLIQLGFGVVGIFEIIFIFNKFNGSLEKVIGLLSLIYILCIIFTPLGAMAISKVGMKKLMMYAMPFAFLSILPFLLWDYAPLYAPIGLVLASVVYKVLYWVPYHVDFATFTDKKTRGRQMSILLSISEVVAVVTPLIGGGIIIAAGFNYLFVISLIILIFAVFPLFFIRDKYEHYSYTYTETYRKLFSTQNRSILVGYMGDGAQSAVTAVIWPVFIFLLLNGEYFTVGAISSLTIFAVIMLRLLVGDLVDRWSRRKTLTIGSILNATGWFIKIFIETGFQIFIVDTYHGLGRVVNQMSIDVTTYSEAVDNGHYIDEFTVLKEISINLGRVLILGIVGVTVFFFSIKFAFLIAAIASLFVTLLNNRLSITKETDIVSGILKSAP